MDLPMLSVKVSEIDLQSNLTDYQAKALEFIESINSELNTDEDFAQAKTDVKSLKGLEDAIKVAEQKVIHECGALYDLLEGLKSLSNQSRAKRLDMDKLVKNREKEIKNLMVEGYQEKAKAMRDRMRSRFEFPEFEYLSYVRGRKGIKGYSEGLDKALQDYSVTVFHWDEKYTARDALFSESAGEHEHLFPDRDRLVQEYDVSILPSIIHARINEYMAKEIKKTHGEPKVAPRVETVETVDEETGEVVSQSVEVEMVTIEKSEYERLLKLKQFIKSLNHFGLKHWEHYNDAVEHSKQCLRCL